MEKAIDIKRRAQRCIQGGDLDGALCEYEKLVGAPESDPYNHVLIADLLFKKGDLERAAERYFVAVSAYQDAALFKNAIAVCKKMLRLSLAPAKVLAALASLHELDGFPGEASLYHVQVAEHLVRSGAPAEAAEALRRAAGTAPENVRVLEQMAEAWLLAAEPARAAAALMEAARRHRGAGVPAEAKRCEERALALDPAAADAPAAVAPEQAPAHGAEAAGSGAVTASHAGDGARDDAAARGDGDTPAEAVAAQPAEAIELQATSLAAAGADAVAHDRLEGLETGRHAPAHAGDEQARAAEATMEIETHAAFAPPPVVAEAPEGFESAHARPAATTAGAGAADADDEGDAPVYEIAEADEEAVDWSLPAVSATADDETTVYDIDADDVDPVRFEAAGEAEPVSEPAAPTAEDLAMAEVERLLERAQAVHHDGDHDEAARILEHAASVCDGIGRHDSAASIYRSLGRGPHATDALLEAWLANCERREDRDEAAWVACELGDRALNDGHTAPAIAWFDRALAFDAGCEVARRRLQRLRPELASETASSAPADRVEVASGNAAAFDLRDLLAEFQKGVKEQLAGDAQSHYDLGMTYREMGLHDQAIESFRAAAPDARFALRAAEMVGRCLADQERHADAAAVFEGALALPGAADGERDLRWHLALALEGAGRESEAVAELERVLELDADFVPAHERIATLHDRARRAA